MKKFLMSCALALASALACNAQFALTPEGWTAPEGKEYYVVTFDGLSQQELYDRVYAAVTGIYVSAKDAVSAQAPQIINIHGYSNGDMYLVQVGKRDDLAFEYNFKILIKDGKIRFDVPVVQTPYSSTDRGCTLKLGCGGGMSMAGNYGNIFKKDGKVRYKDALESLETYFNNLVTAIVTRVETPAVEEDW